MPAAEELGLSRRPMDDVFNRHMSANTIVSTGFIALGLGGAVASGLTLLLLGREFSVLVAAPILMAASIFVCISGGFQRRHSLAAITVNAVLATLFLAALLVGFPLRIMYGAAHGRFHWGIVAYLTLILAGLTFVLTIPLRLAIQAWQWHRQGIVVMFDRSDAPVRP